MGEKGIKLDKTRSILKAAKEGLEQLLSSKHYSEDGTIKKDEAISEFHNRVQMLMNMSDKEAQARSLRSLSHPAMSWIYETGSLRHIAIDLTCLFPSAAAGERSFCDMRGIHTHHRASMTQEHLVMAAKVKLNRQQSKRGNDAVKRFSRSENLLQLFFNGDVANRLNMLGGKPCEFYDTNPKELHEDLLEENTMPN